MKILNLYAGIGGNRKLWGIEHNITAVEKDPRIAGTYKELYPEDDVICGDAHEFLLQNYNRFDFIWSSPPCQSHSRMVKATRHDVRKYPDMNLYQEIVWLSEMFEGKWIVENVNPYYDPLIPPTKKIGRHLFWGNFRIGNIEYPKMPDFITTDSVSGAEELKDWLGIHYEGNIYYGNNHSPAQILRNCVHPEIGKYILDRAKGIYRKSNDKQMSLI